jgi:hypothetical protein
MTHGVTIGGSYVFSAEQRLDNRIAAAIEGVVHRPAEGSQFIDRVEVRPDADGNILVAAGASRRVFQNTTTGRLAAAQHIKAAVLAGREPEIPEELG